MMQCSGAVPLPRGRMACGQTLMKTRKLLRSSHVDDTVKAAQFSTATLHPWFLSSIHLQVSARGKRKSKSYVYFAQNLHLRLRSNIGNMDLSCLLSGITGYKASNSAANYNRYLKDEYSILAVCKRLNVSRLYDLRMNSVLIWRSLHYLDIMILSSNLETKFVANIKHQGQIDFRLVHF